MCSKEFKAFTVMRLDNLSDADWTGRCFPDPRRRVEGLHTGVDTKDRIVFEEVFKSAKVSRKNGDDVWIEVANIKATKEGI